MDLVTMVECGADPCPDILCKCGICQVDSESLRIFKHNLVCESCLDYIRKDIPVELQIPLEASFSRVSLID